MDNLLNQHPADIAERLSQMDEKERNISFLMFNAEKKAEVFPYFDSDIQQEIIEGLGNSETRDLINNLAPDDRTQIFTEFPDNIIKQTINLLGEKQKREALSLIGYPEDCIARLMTPNYIQAKPSWTVERVLNHIKIYGKKAETLNFVYVVDDDNKLIDDLRIGELLLSDNNKTIEELMDHNFVCIKTIVSIEDSLKTFEKYEREAIPIVTENNTLVGIVTFDDILNVIQERDTEDIHKFGGMTELDLSYVKTSSMEMVKKRAGWLVVLFLGEILTTSAMGYFEHNITQAVVLALFVPLIISSGGNTGSQAASLIIRAMALKELQLSDWWYVMKKEFVSGFILGLILGIIGFLKVFAWQMSGIYDYGEYWMWIGLSVSCSLMVVVLWGTLSGSLIPFILRRAKLDPATASAPFVATLVDVTGIVFFFSISALFLAGKLL